MVSIMAEGLYRAQFDPSREQTALGELLHTLQATVDRHVAESGSSANEMTTGASGILARRLQKYLDFELKSSGVLPVGCRIMVSGEGANIVPRDGRNPEVVPNYEGTRTEGTFDGVEVMVVPSLGSIARAQEYYGDLYTRELELDRSVSAVLRLRTVVISHPPLTTYPPTGLR